MHSRVSGIFIMWAVDVSTQFIFIYFLKIKIWCHDREIEMYATYSILFRCFKASFFSLIIVLLIVAFNL